VRQILAISNFLALLELRLLGGTIGRRDEMILSIHPSRHGLLTPTGQRKHWSDGPIKLAPLKEEKML
jgi:hypothetical protein